MVGGRRNVGRAETGRAEPRAPLLAGLAILAALGACPDELDSPVIPDPARTTTTTATKADAKVPVVPALPGKCENAPAWRTLRTCVDGSTVYAAGDAPAGLNASLARSTASDRARQAIAIAMSQGSDPVILTHTEVLWVFRCDDSVYALARTPAPKRLDLPDCDPAVVASAPPAPRGDCPAWTQRVSWLDGEQLFGVGLVDGVRNPSLAERTAIHRAMTNASKLHRLVVRLAGGNIESGGRVLGLAELSREIVRCDDAIYARVATRPTK